MNGDAVFRAGYGPEQSTDNTQLLRMLAEAGNTNKQFELGSVLEKRHEIADAIFWFEEAAARGNTDAVEALKRLKPASESR
jgi:TPR repeat protein